MQSSLKTDRTYSMMYAHNKLVLNQLRHTFTCSLKDSRCFFILLKLRPKSCTLRQFKEIIQVFIGELYCLCPL